jgi:hypothetical protein
MKNALQAIKQARKIHTECNNRAQKIEARIIKMKYGKTVASHVKYINGKWDMEQEVNRLRERGAKVWSAVTSFQGKYIDWKNIHVIDGKTYNGIFELLDASLK